MDGGPAFPIPGVDHSEEVNEDGYEGYVKWTQGMSLRDFFAASALQGGLEQGAESDAPVGPEFSHYWYPAQKIAARAYEIADAMLKERDR